MAVATEKSTERSIFAFWRRGEQWLEISGYHAGDIQSEEPVLIKEGATVVGNVFAPQVAVEGLLNGSLIARKTAVSANGQIWGDIYTLSLDMAPGSKVQGWITTLDEDNYPKLHKNGTIPADPVALFLPTIDPDGSLDVGSRPPSTSQIYALRYLQAEAATAMAARSELEQAFEKRLMEVAGDSSAKVHSLHEDLDAARAELNEMRLQLGEAQEGVRSRENRLKRQVNELSTTRVLLTERNRELTELRKTTAEQEKMNAALQTAKTQLEQKVLAAQEQLDKTNGRLQSLEAAFQANLQHSAEQEESLERWQELTEITQRRVTELEGELEGLHLQVVQSNQINEMLREQRQQLEEEWQNALQELETVREQTAVIASSPLEDSTQLLWHKTNLRALQQELEETRHIAYLHEKELTELQTVLLANQSQTEAERSQLEGDLERQKKQWEQQLQQVRERNEVEKQILQASLHDMETRLSQSERLLDEYYDQVRNQGQQLAESRATLVEKDIALQTLQQKLGQQAQALELLKQRASSYINDLQKQLKQAQRQVHDLTQILERKIKKPLGD